MRTSSRTFRQRHGDDQIINRDRVSRRHSIVRKKKKSHDLRSGRVGHERGRGSRKGPCGFIFGVDSEPLRTNEILESGFKDFFSLFSFLIRKADPGKEEYRRVETGGAESNKCGDPNQ